MMRYEKQVQLQEIGARGQQKLADATVTIVGVGALGSLTASFLVRAGIGRTRLIDYDYVELANLHRQVLFNEEDVCNQALKGVAAKRALQKANSDVVVDSVLKRLSPDNALLLLSDTDIVVDATDNVPTRLLINDTCLQTGIPLVFGAVSDTSGLSMTIVPGETPCLRCAFPSIATAVEVPSSNNRGVFPPVVGEIAATQAAEAIKLIIGSAPRQGLISVDSWSGNMESIEVKRSSNCQCSTRCQEE